MKMISHLLNISDLYQMLWLFAMLNNTDILAICHMLASLIITNILVFHTLAFFLQLKKSSYKRKKMWKRSVSE